MILRNEILSGPCGGVNGTKDTFLGVFRDAVTDYYYSARTPDPAGSGGATPHFPFPTYHPTGPAVSPRASASAPASEREYGRGVREGIKEAQEARRV